MPSDQLQSVNVFRPEDCEYMIRVASPRFEDGVEFSLFET